VLPRATENAVAGHVWIAGRYLPTPDLAYSFVCCSYTETYLQRLWK